MDTISVTLPSGQRFAGVVSLVLGGLGSRLNLAVDRIEDLTLVVGSVAESAQGDELSVQMTVSDTRLVVCVGPLEGGAATDPARRRLVDPLVDGVREVRRDGSHWLELELAHGEAG